MSENSFINILIAEDNEVSREMMAGVLRTQGFNVHGAVDGDSAIQVVRDKDIDVALVDINMAPTGGFEFVRYLVAKGIKVPVVIITSDDSSDILTVANGLGVSRVLQKPVGPDRLIQTVHQILKRRGVNPGPLAVESHETHFSPEDIMRKVIALADKNASSKKGGPFGAIVTDVSGKILGEGASGVSGRVDPVAHAEVMAIRQAAEKLGRADLSDCVLYCSSEPTMMGKSLVLSVGIKKVYYGLTHVELSQLRPRERSENPEYIQISHDKALEMFRRWQTIPGKIAD
jgi:tRNA(Arg) A34 adenosine deaminase TadA/CheY-like chemotaxis protein